MSQQDSQTIAKEAELRNKAFAWIPDANDFMLALEAARIYHSLNPYAEEGLLGDCSTEHASDKHKARLEKHSTMIEQINKNTLDHLAWEHRLKTMEPFIRMRVPEALAGEIVDELVFKAAKQSVNA